MPSSANLSTTRCSTLRGLSADRDPSGLNMSAITWLTPGSHGTACNVVRSGTATTSGSPAEMPPSMSTTSPIGEVP